jgi:protein-disulfide isomerase
VQWRFFSLYQVNHEGDDAWRIWDQPMMDPNWQERDYGPSLRCFWAAEAARRQGEGAFLRFHRALLQARHRNGLSLVTSKTLFAAAKTAGLDMKEFQESLGDPACLERLAEDHERAEGMDVFGTPTFVFPEAEPAYLKLRQLPETEEGLAFWEEFQRVVAGRPFVLEIKRPH